MDSSALGGGVGVVGAQLLWEEHKDLQGRTDSRWLKTNRKTETGCSSGSDFYWTSQEDAALRLRDFQTQTDTQTEEPHPDWTVWWWLVDKVDKKAAVMDVREKPGCERADGEDEGPRGGAAPADPGTVIRAGDRWDTEADPGVPRLGGGPEPPHREGSSEGGGNSKELHYPQS